jgi:hypothetical protein
MLEDVCATDVAGVRATPPAGGEAIVRVSAPPGCPESAPADGAHGDGEARWHAPDGEPSAVD